MKLKSNEILLDLARQKDSGIFDFTQNKDLKCSLQSFSGTVGDALDTAIGGFYRIMNIGTSKVDANTIIRTALSNGRIFRGISQMKSIESGNGEYTYDYLGLVTEYTQVGLALTNVSPEYLDLITNFSKQLGKILDLEISQKHDAESWIAMNPYYSRYSVEKINNDLGRDDYLFIALGNGGIIPGFDVYTKLKRETGERGTFYPVRFSRMKSKDRFPFLTSSETEQLQNLTVGKKIVVFDEDSSSGNTLFAAEDFLNEQFPLNKGVIKRSNIGVHGYRRYM